jgi:ATP-dependent Clp protease adaptor protein ClpS
MSNYNENKELESVLDSSQGYLSFLTLHDDDLHTFEYVIESLIEVCNHDMEQAEQCTYLVHYKGKCDVKKGSPTYLTPFKRELSRRGLKVTIN